MSHWIHKHAIALTFVILVVFVAVLFARQQQSFNEHRSIDDREEYNICKLVESRWDTLHDLIIIGLTPVAQDDQQTADVLRLRQKQMLDDLGPRNTCHKP